MTEEQKEQKQIAKELLNLHWGYSDFRPGQDKVLDNVFMGKNTVVIMPTGGGKSLCYQLPALVFDGVSVVVSPLISLMKDQVDSLQRIGIPATFINSSISLIETRTRLAALGSGAYKIVYVAPERFYSQEFMDMLKQLKVSLFAIDEAHCISQWGHDFRPSYIRLRNAISQLGNPLVLALTATATPEVREDIIKQLGLENPELVITGFGRPNLQFGVIQAKEAEKPSYVLDTVQSFPDATGIVYVSTRARVDELTQYLLRNGIEASAYHAGMDDNDRKWTQNAFIDNRIKVIVATNAFGLGIDKPDVRYVIHYDMPGTVEAYYQEAGRAGRDGQPSLCLLLFNSRDRYLHEFFIKGDNPPAEIIREIYNILLSYEDDRIMITYSELSEMLLGSVPEMAIGTSIKLLEKEGYLRRANEMAGSATLKLLKSADSIVEAMGSRAKKQKELFTKLVAKYPNELNDGSPIRLEEIAEILEVKKDAILRLIRKLSQDNLAEYKPPFRGTEIQILKRIDPKSLQLDFDTLKYKLSRAYEKLDRMEDYIYESACRQRMILDYFGEADGDKCGKCDLCLSGARNFRPRKEVSIGSEDEKIEKAGLSTKLTQLDTLELFKRGLTLKQMAKERDLSTATIVDHLLYLLDLKAIKLDELKVLVDNKVRKQIREKVLELGKQKMKPIFYALGERVSYDEIRLVLAEIS